MLAPPGDRQADIRYASLDALRLELDRHPDIPVTPVGDGVHQIKVAPVRSPGEKLHLLPVFRGHILSHVYLPPCMYELIIASRASSLSVYFVGLPFPSRK